MYRPCQSASTCVPFSCPAQQRPCIYQEDNDYGYDYSYDDDYYDNEEEDFLSETCTSCADCDCMDFDCCPPGECICGPDVFTTLLGPTADESILVGLQTFLGLTYKCPPGFPNPKAANTCCGGSCPGADCANTAFCKMAPCLKNQTLTISNQPPISVGSSGYSGYSQRSDYYNGISGSEENETEIMNVGINNFIPCPVKRHRKPRIQPCPAMPRRRRRQRPIIRPRILCGPPVPDYPKYYCYSYQKPSEDILPSDRRKSNKSFKSLRSLASNSPHKKKTCKKTKRTNSTESESSNVSGAMTMHAIPSSHHGFPPPVLTQESHLMQSSMHQPHAQHHPHSTHQTHASPSTHHEHHPHSVKSAAHHSPSRHSTKSYKSNRSKRMPSYQYLTPDHKRPSKSNMRASQFSISRRKISSTGPTSAMDDPRVDPTLRRLSQHECPKKTDEEEFKEKMLLSEARKTSRSGIDLDKRLSRRSLLDAERRSSKDLAKMRRSVSISDHTLEPRHRSSMHVRHSRISHGHLPVHEKKESKSTTCAVGCLCAGQQTAPLTCEKLAQTKSAAKMSGPICCKCLNTMPRSGATCICSSPTTCTCTEYSLSQRKTLCPRQSKLSCCVCNRANNSSVFTYDKMPSVCICEKCAFEKSSTPQSICICGSSKPSYSCDCGSVSPCVCKQRSLKQIPDFMQDKPECERHSHCWCNKADFNESMISRPTTCLCATNTDSTPTRPLSNCLCLSENPCECIDVVQTGDTNSKCDIRFAITKITKFDNYTTFEVMKSTKKKPKSIPTLLEGVFVLKNK